MELGGALRAQQPDRHPRHEPARPARRDDARLERRRLRRPRQSLRLACHRDRRPRPRRDRPRLRRGDARRPTRRRCIVARTIKGKGFSEIENKNGWHGKALPQDMAERAIESLAAYATSSCRCRSPRTSSQRQRPAPQPVQLPKYDIGASVATRSAYGDALKALGAARSDIVAVDGEVQQLDLRRDLRQRLPRPLLRAVHRRAADGRVGGGLAGAWLRAVRLDLRGVLHARLRLHPHGRRLARQHPPRRLARRRLDWRGWPVADGAGRPGDDARGLRQHGALSERREPDGAARRGDGRDQGHLLPAHDAREDAGDLRPRRAVPHRRQPGRAPVRPATR